MQTVKIAKDFKILKDAIKDNLFFFFFLIIYYAIIIFLSGYLNIWEDELYSLNTSSKTLSYAFHQSEFFELQPPFYFLLLTIWRSVSDTIIWARMLNVFLIIILQILLYRFIIKKTDKKRAILFSILFLLNPTIVYFLLEIRLPALLILLSFAITLLFYDTYYCYNISFTRRVFYIILTVAGLFTQHYFGFLLFANALILLIGGKKRAFWLYILDMILPLCLILSYIPHIIMSANMVTAASPEYSSTGLDVINEIKILFSQVTFGYFLPTDFIVTGIWKWIIRATFIVSCIFLGYQVRKKIDFHNFYLFILIALIIFTFFLFVYFHFGRYSVLLPKYTIIIFAPIFISIVLLFRHAELKFLNSIVFLFALLYLYVNYTRYHELYKHHDFRSVSNFLKQDEKEGQDIFVYRNINAEVLKVYYKGINEIYPIMEPFSFDSVYSIEDWVLTKQDIQRFNERIKGNDVFYIIIFENELPEFKEFKQNFVEFLRINYKIDKEEYFKQYIFLYRISAKD